MQATLTQGSIARGLFNLAVPMAGGLLATMSFNIVDTFFVSGLGDAALAALSFTFPVAMFVMSLAIGLGAGTSTAVAVAAGRHDEQAIKDYITDSMSLSAILVLALSIVGVFTIDPLFTALGANRATLPLIAEYMVPWYLGAVFLVVPMVAMAALRALGNTRLQAEVMIAMAVFNAVLDPILIYGWWVFPRLEIQGAAIASLIVRVISTAMMFYYFHYRLKVLENPFNLTRALASWKKILHVGIPAMATNMIIPASGAIIIAMVASHGVDAVAGFGVATRVEAIALIAFYALSAVIGPFCGQNLGAGKFDRVRDSQKVSGIFCLISGLLIAAVLALFGSAIGSIFSDEENVIQVVASYLAFVPLSYFAYGVVMVVNASFNGLGKPLPGVLLSSTRVIFLLFPLAWLFNNVFGLTGVFAAIALSNVIVGLWAYIWIHKTVDGIEPAV